MSVKRILALATAVAVVAWGPAGAVVNAVLAPLIDHLLLTVVVLLAAHFGWKHRPVRLRKRGA